MDSKYYSILCLIIYVLLWSFMYFRRKKKNEGICISTTTIACFFVYSVVSLLLFISQDIWVHDSKYENITLFPLIYLFLMILCSIYPLIKYDNIGIVGIQLPSKIIVEVFLALYGLSSLAVLPYIYSSMETGLVMLIVQNQGDELYSVRNEMEMSGTGVYKLPLIIEYFKQYHGRLSDLSVFMSALYCLYKNKNKKLIYIVCFSIIVDLLEPLSQGLRTNVIMKMWAIVAVVCLFYRFWDFKLRKIIKYAGVVLLIIVSIPFMLLTISRFGDRTQAGGTVGEMLSYTGQANLNFDMYCLDAGGIRYGDRTASVIKGWFVGESKGLFDVREKYFNLKIDDSHFYTYVGDFTLDYGPVGAVLIFLVVMFLYVIFVVPKSKIVKAQELCLLYLLGTICLQGAMYLFFYSYSWNWRIIYAVLFYFIFAFDYQVVQGGRHIYAIETSSKKY